MGHIGTPQFTNDVGAEKIEIGVKEFKLTQLDKVTSLDML